MRSPIVSVLMPVFNEKPLFLKQALDSILSQTFRDFEVLICDDGSNSPATLEVLKTCGTLDNRIHMHKFQNRGLTRTLNLGLSLCRGEFVCRHDSDDWSEPDRLARQLAFMKANPQVALVGSNAMLHQEDGTELWRTSFPLNSRDIMTTFPKTNPFCHGATCFRKTVAQAVGGYWEDLGECEDYDFFWRVCEQGNGANLAEVLYHLRRTGSSFTATRGWEMKKRVFVVQRIAEMRRSGEVENLHLALSEVNMHFSRNELWSRVLDHADRQMLAGYYARAANALLKSVVMRPLCGLTYLKMIRLILFVLAPPMRRFLFIG